MALLYDLFDRTLVWSMVKLPAASATSLPSTGKNTMGFAAFAILLLCIGVMAVLVSRHTDDEMEVDLRDEPKKRVDYLRISEQPVRKYSSRK